MTRPSNYLMVSKAENAGISVRNVAHGGVKVVGDKALRLLTVHIVDKGKPLYDSPKKAKANSKQPSPS